MKRKHFSTVIILIFLCLYLILNCLTLMHFPNVHSDELWLMGLTEKMIDDKTVFTTEAFFDLYPRVEHPFRWFYHGTYAIFMFLFGPTVFTGRFVSLVGALFSLYIFFKWLNEKWGNWIPAIFATLILSLNSQLISSAHTGRQETWILFVLILLVYWVDLLKFTPIVYALITGLAIGIHPNSFIIGVVGAGLLTAQIIKKDRPIKDLFKYVIYTSLLAALYLFIGWLNDPEFLSKYMQFGASLGIDSEPISRVEGFYWFFYKLFNQIGGTYDLYNIKSDLFLVGISILIGIAYYKNKTAFNMLAVTSGILLALFLIGRYNQTSILFLMPWYVIIFCEILKKNRLKTLVLYSVLSVYLLYSNVITYYENMPYYKSYATMRHEIDAYIPEDAVVLGNLNLLEVKGKAFYDYRNLGFLNTSFEAYVQSHNIDTILYHEEMDYLENTSPKWDFLYVDLWYLPEMRVFLETKCDLIATIENPAYAMRITKYTGTYPWTTKIYRVKKP